MGDALSITAIVVSIGGVIINLIKEVHIQKCKALCCFSDCTKPAEAKGKFKIVKSESNSIVIQPCPDTPPIVDEELNSSTL